jgi:acetyltransferase
MIDDPDTDIVIIDAELPKAPHELRERNLRIVNDMGAPPQARGLHQRMSIGFTEFTKALRSRCRTSRSCRVSIARSARSSR